ncbi:MAG: GNAT family N-acetyltransferase [Bdellovibrionia bacterium]
MQAFRSKSFRFGLGLGFLFFVFSSVFGVVHAEGYPSLEQIEALGQEDRIHPKNCRGLNAESPELLEILMSWQKSGGAHENIARVLLRHLHEAEFYTFYHYLLVCNPSGELMAMAEYKVYPFADHGTNMTFVQHLLGNPYQRGGGTAAIRHLVRESLLTGVESLQLMATESSVGFYQKLGFRSQMKHEMTYYFLTEQDMIRRYFPR